MAPIKTANSPAIDISLGIGPILSSFPNCKSLAARWFSARGDSSCVPPKECSRLKTTSVHVAQCDCGTVHVTVGPVSVALDTQALRRLRDLVGAAIDKIDSAAEAPNELEQPKPILPHLWHLAVRKVMKPKH
jgi:hypothetical protein